VVPGGGVLPSINAKLIPKQDIIGVPVQQVKKAVTKKPFKKVIEKKVKHPLSLPFPLNANITHLSELNLRKANKGMLPEKPIKLIVLQADITDVAVDAICHPTNGTLYLGGQVGSAISRVGGEEVRKIIQEVHLKNGNLAQNSVDISYASKNMKCKHIIHVHSPSWSASDQITKINELTQVVKNILTLAEKNNLKSIALPSISSGGY